MICIQEREDGVFGQGGTASRMLGHSTMTWACDQNVHPCLTRSFYKTFIKQVNGQAFLLSQRKLSPTTKIKAPSSMTQHLSLPRYSCLPNQFTPLFFHLFKLN